MTNGSSSNSFRTANSGTTYHTARETLLGKRERNKNNEVTSKLNVKKWKVSPTNNLLFFKNKPLQNLPIIFQKLSRNLKNDFKLDTGEKKLMSYAASPLIAMENAAELLKVKVLHKGDFIENVLKFITNGVPNTGFVSSKALFENNLKTNRENIQNIKDLKLELTKKSLNSSVNRFVSILGLDIGNGGHYAAYIYDKKQNIVTLFDSMQWEDSYDRTTKSGASSAYTEKFKDALKMIFGTNIKITVDPLRCNIQYRYCYQCTGGFVNGKDLLKKTLTKSVLITHQNLESQHHFCYMEALLFLTERLHGYAGNMNYNRNTKIRLVAIKKFIWILINNRKILPRVSNVPYGLTPIEWKYLKANFMCFWNDFGITLNTGNHGKFTRNGPLKFRRYEIPTTYLTNTGNNIQSILDKVHSGNTKNNFMRVSP